MSELQPGDNRCATCPRGKGLFSDYEYVVTVLRCATQSLIGTETAFLKPEARRESAAIYARNSSLTEDEAERTILCAERIAGIATEHTWSEGYCEDFQMLNNDDPAIRMVIVRKQEGSEGEVRTLD